MLKDANEFHYNNVRNWLHGKITDIALGESVDFNIFPPAIRNKIQDNLSRKDGDFRSIVG